MTSIQQCVICYEELTQDLSAAPCGHVFHSFCINKWNSPGRCCPICHVVLPSELLKLYYEPQKDAPDETAVVGCAPDCGTKDVEAMAAEMEKLQRKLTKSNKRFMEGENARTQKAKELEDLKREVAAAHVVTANSQKELETAKIDLFKKHRDNNRLKREMEGNQKRLREIQGDQVAYSYLSQFSSPARGRALVGLGQTDVEKVLGQIRQGYTQADTVIRSQHEQLTGSMEREQRAKRELRKWKQEGETVALELQGVRSRLARARKEVSRLDKALAEATVKAERQARDRESASSPGPSAGTILGDWVAEERPCGNGGESKWALSRKSVNGRPGSKAPSAPRATASLASKPAKRKRVERADEENEDDLVSLGSESEGEGDSSEDEDEEAESGSHGDPKKTAERRAASRDGGGALGGAALIKPGLPSRTFLTSAVVRSGSGGQPNRKPGKLINKGFNAVGGRHLVVRPSASSSTKPAFYLGGKQSRLATTSRNRTL
ncbi:conserved unknown protein [Ectocarpus siliculosus]|uniref:RING-type domain-containing protein n=1 Tax=Ectocarpus siliculosus TaxID=2880 RepID=D7G7Y3_ECTSI|nr:conserved unknown protein [Ectocarpus siliculosus]|eukprot:CBJ27858.1 conserved unknown protein [Ectocarpus siliculosus]